MKKYAIFKKLESFDIEIVFQEYMETYNKNKEILINSLVYENSKSMNYWLDLQLFYQIALQLKYKISEAQNANSSIEQFKIKKDEVKSSRKQNFLNIFRK